MPKRKETKHLFILVCVTGQKTCERLIAHGAALAEESGAVLEVVHAVRENALFLDNESEGEALEYLFGVSKRYGADMTLLRARDVLASLIEHARERKATTLVVGAPDTTGFVNRLADALPGVEIEVMHGEEENNAINR